MSTYPFFNPQAGSQRPLDTPPAPFEGNLYTLAEDMPPAMFDDSTLASWCHIRNPPLTTLQLARHLHSRAASPDRSTSSEKALKTLSCANRSAQKCNAAPPLPPNHPVSRPERRRHHDITFAPAQLAYTHFPRKSYRQCPFSPSYSAHLHTPCRRIQPRQHLCNPKDGPRSNNRITR